MSTNRILCVGLVCIDVICEVDSYPAEDEKRRIISQRRQRGGNAANNCSLLGSFGSSPCFFGTITGCNERKFIEDNFREFGVDLTYAVIVHEGECPNSCVVLSLATGSRTIVHYNPNLREPTVEDFAKIDLPQFSWVHFEGRNIAAALKMIQLIQDWNVSKDPRIKISVELEKANPSIEELIPVADIVFISKEYAKIKGWQNGRQTLDIVSKWIQPDATVICTWGEKGAGTKTGPNGEIFWCEAFSPEKVCDTLAAGDTFIGSTVYALNAGETVKKSVTFGCRVAGFKVGFKGWREFREAVLSLDFVQDIVGKYNRKCSG